MYYNYYYIINNYYKESHMDKKKLEKNFVTCQQQPLPDIQVPIIEPTIIPTFVTGILSIKVLNELGLPVKDALITVFHFHPSGELEVHYNLRTDENGDVPEMELPILQSQFPSEYHYAIYNLRVLTENYMPLNIVNFEVFPDIKTNFIARLTPITEQGMDTSPEKTLVTPNR